MYEGTFEGSSFVRVRVLCVATYIFTYFRKYGGTKVCACTCVKYYALYHFLHCSYCTYYLSKVSCYCSTLVFIRYFRDFVLSYYLIFSYITSLHVYTYAYTYCTRTCTRTLYLLWMFVLFKYVWVQYVYSCTLHVLYGSTFVLSYFRTYENTTFAHVHTTCKLLILVPCLISSGTKVPSYFRTCLLYQLHTVPSYKSTTATAIPIKSIFTSVDMRFQNSGFHVTVTISIDNYCIENQDYVYTYTQG